ncbi:MAG: tripartite tricarboxylate transporter substrate binding protein [Proteobacteria bacterium]|nr:tripartite tricarboxylate transporter substrate binding protein [Pseudomonadota bacterium]
MKLLRAFVVAAGCLLAAGAQAQDYPSKIVRIVVPFPAGGTTDILTRAIAQKLTEEWKQQVIVDNRPGGGANIGAEHAVKSPADGYTLLMASTVHSINVSLYPKLNYDPLKDFTPITLVAETPQVLVVHPSVPASNLKEFIALLKSSPTQFTYSSAGNGSQPHLAAELFKTMTGTNMLHVPYKGGPPAMTDLIAGHVNASFATGPSAVPNVKTGKIKALGVSTTRRVPALPDVPTIAEAGVPGYEASGFFGLVGPPGLSPALVAKINAAVVRIVKDPAMGKYLSEQGAEPLTSTPAEYAALIRDEVTKWTKVVKDSGAKID